MHLAYSIKLKSVQKIIWGPVVNVFWKNFLQSYNNIFKNNCLMVFSAKKNYSVTSTDRSCNYVLE